MEEARTVAWFMTGLRRETIRLIKKHRRIQECELLILNEQLWNEAEGEAIAEKVNTIAATIDTFAEVYEKLFLQETSLLLTSQQLKVIKASVLEGVTEQEIANEMGVSQQAVNRLKVRGLNRLRNYLHP